MAFFDNIGKKASETAAKAMQRAQDLSETARLNTMISDQEKRINTAYSQIGKLYVEIHRDDGEEAFSELLEVIRDAEKKINGYRQQLQDMKEGLRCGKCGAVVSRDSSFCSACGAKIEEKAADGPRCEKCGAPITSWMRFCTVCGNPLSQPADTEATSRNSTRDAQLMIPEITAEPPAEPKETVEQVLNKSPRPEDVNMTTAEPAIATETRERIIHQPEERAKNDWEMQPQATAPNVTQITKRVCPHCGAEVDDDQLFCIECGNGL